jgi:hypothetical protein
MLIKEIHLGGAHLHVEDVDRRMFATRMILSQNRPLLFYDQQELIHQTVRMASFLLSALL